MRDLGQRAAAWMRDVIERGDRYAQMVGVSTVAMHDLAIDDPSSARARVVASLDGWVEAGYTIQHYHAMRLQIHCDLYEGATTDALSRLTAEIPKMRRAQLYRISLSRIEALALEAVVLLNALSAGADAAQRRRCEKIARALGRERRIDGLTHGQLVRAWLSALAGKDTGASLDETAAAYRAAGMTMWARCAALTAAELRGDDTAVAAERSALEANGITDVARWRRQYVPSLRP
jgi:hypothetical protein